MENPEQIPARIPSTIRDLDDEPIALTGLTTGAGVRFRQLRFDVSAEYATWTLDVEELGGYTEQLWSLRTAVGFER